MPENLPNVRSLFDRALEIESSADRRKFLDETCPGPEVRAQVETLLAAHAAAGNFLEIPPTAVQGASETARHDPAAAPLESFLSPSEQADSLGHLGEYEVLEVIGRGGMGVVLKARDRTLDRVVALKVLAPELASNPTARKRFQREARTAAAVVHQHVVTIHAVAEDRLPYLVMECVAGQSLKDKIDRAGHLPLVEILRIGQQVASGLAAAHAQGLIHRDVKPANILLENGVERVRITDFGLARAVDDVEMTRSGEVAGTPQYMSPEQAQGLPIDARSDLFSLGGVLYTMCTGRPPFRAESAIATARRVCEDAPRPIREVNPEIPQWLAAIIDRLLAKQPGERFQTATEVAHLLGQRLADLQLPTSSELGDRNAEYPVSDRPAAQTAIRDQRSTNAKRLLSVAAAAILLLFGVGLTEATGVTQFAPTLLRIVTGDGTLLVEVNDPAIKITVEGDGGLVITGAGLHQVHLKPGKYQLRADKDGQRVPLSQELVTIMRGDTQVVRVRLELTPQDANSWGHRGRSYRGINKLDEAIADFNKAIELDPSIAWLWANRGDVYAKRQDWDRAIADCSQAVRLEPNTQWICLALMSKYAEAERFDQAALAVDQALSVVPVPEDAWRGNPPLVVAAAEWKEIFERLVKLRPQDPRPWAVRIELLASRGKWQEAAELLSGLIEVDGANHWAWYSASVLHLQTGNAEGYRRVCDEMLKRFGDTADVFIADRTAKTLLLVPGAAADVDVPRKLALLAAAGAPSNQWFHLTSGLAEYRAGNFEAAALCLRKSIYTPAGEAYLEAPSLVLMAMSQHQLGHKDQAIESLKRADQLIAQRVPKLASGLIENWGDWIRLDLLRREAAALIEPKSERGAFVVLGASGVAERRFDTLAAAVLKSGDGDTIEIRGNGPFATEPIKLSSRRAIRAGQGFRPVLSLDAVSPPAGRAPVCLLEAWTPLVLEGLEIRGDIDPSGHPEITAVKSLGAPLHVANCRFIRCQVSVQSSTACQLRNSQFSTAKSFAVLCIDAAGGVLDANIAVVLDNNIVANGGGTPLHLFGLGNVQRMDLTRNVFTAGNAGAASAGFFITLRSLRRGQTAVPAPLQVSHNIVSGQGCILRSNHTSNSPADPPPIQLEAAELELLVRERLAWREVQNLYSTGTPLLSLCQVNQSRILTSVQPAQPIKTLAEWNQFWDQSDTGSIQGAVRFQGGEAVYRSPYTLGPHDFRLLSDSAGYRAGPDSKDLGPDIDLVGPGEAYERWKKTPEYQKWLEETGQKK